MPFWEFTLKVTGEGATLEEAFLDVSERLRKADAFSMVARPLAADGGDPRRAVAQADGAGR